MSDNKLKTAEQFRADNGLSRTQAYYLDLIGRGPKYLEFGRKKMVSPEADWRKAMADSPIKGSLRKHALAAAATSDAAVSAA
jgi:hypothetical protein